MQTRTRLREVSATRTSDGGTSGGVGRPTDSTEHDTGERVSENELKNTRDEQQKTAEEDNRTTFPLISKDSLIVSFDCDLHEGNSVSTGSSPGHQAAREGSRSNDKTSQCPGS